MITKILNSVSDFAEKIDDGTIKVCFLHENSKISKQGWAGFVKPEELYDEQNNENNLGISLTGPRFPGDTILTCIDIDGDKTKGKKTEQFTKNWIYQIIKHKLDQENIKYMAIKSSSGGYHLYLYTINESLRYESTKGLYYPKTKKNLPTTTQMYLDANTKHLQKLQNEEVPKSIVEIWCNKRYMVAPGSDIYNKKGQYIGTTTLLPDGVQKFGEISTYKGNLNNLIRQAFLENNYIENTQIEYIKYTNPDINSRTYSPTLNQFNIQVIGDLLLEAYPKIPGQKHTATLALGGYLYNKKISLQSIQQIGEYVAKKAPDNLFDNKQAFIDTLTHDTREEDQTRLQTGLPTFEEILSPHYSKEYIGKKLHLATNPTFHKFWPDGKYSKKFDEIIINHQQNYTTKNIIQTSINKKGEIIENKIKNYNIQHSIEEIKQYNDISNPENKDDWEKAVQLTFKTTEGITYKSKIYETPDMLFKEYRQLKGVYTDHAKSIIEHIYREYEKLGFIQQINSSTKPGIWYSTETKKIQKFIKKGNEIIYISPQQPNRQDLKQALELLKQLNDIIPWQKGKFGFILKNGLTLPYADILKYHFDKPHQNIILHGEAGTLKTTISELLVNFNINSLENKEINIISGGELHSEYRFGRAMDLSSFPLVVNEAEYLFTSMKIKELIKDAVTGKLIRKPGGNNPHSYYSHRASIYTMNNLPLNTEDPAFLRRFIPIEFDQTERCDIPEITDKLDILNKNGIINYRFREFQIIGDFTYWYLSQNQHLFNQSIEEIQNTLITELENYINTDLTFMKIQQKDFIYIDRSDQENVKLTMVLETLRKPYIHNKHKFINNNPLTIVQKLIDGNTSYPYINKINNNEILIDIGFKHKFAEQHYNSPEKITLKSCYYLLQDLDLELNSLQYTTAKVIGRRKKIRGIKMTIEDFTKILINKKEVQ